MEWIDTLVKIAGGLTALGLLWKVMASLVGIRERFDKLEEHDREQYLMLLRLTIMNPEMPIGERVAAGVKYLEMGGNGEVKAYLKETFNIDETTSTASHYVKTPKK